MNKSGTIKLIFQGKAVRSTVYITLQDRKDIIEKWKKQFGWFSVQIKPDVDMRQYNIAPKCI